MVKPIRLGIGSAFGDGKQIQSWIHLHDLAKMYFLQFQTHGKEFIML